MVPFACLIKPVHKSPTMLQLFRRPRRINGKEKNWIKTIPGKGWFTYLRFYSPTEAFFNQTWRPDDIIEIN
jgi:hypothetical protein